MPMEVGQFSWPSFYSRCQKSSDYLLPLSQAGVSSACHGLTEGPQLMARFSIHVHGVRSQIPRRPPGSRRPGSICECSPVRRRHRRSTWALSITWFVAPTCLSPSVSRYMSAAVPPSCPRSYPFLPPWHLCITAHRFAGVVLSYYVVSDADRRNILRIARTLCVYLSSLL